MRIHTLLFVVSFAPVAVPAAAVLHADESAFQAAAGAVIIEDFEGGSVLDPVPGIAGGTFEMLSNGSLPAKYDFSAGGTNPPPGGSFSLMNNDKLDLPGLGDIVLNALPGQSWSSIGFWDIGADDTIRITIFNDADDQLATAVTLDNSVPDFIGFTGLSGATKAVFSADAGNDWFAIDNLQYTPVPLPGGLALMWAALGLLGLTRRGERRG